jgi:RNA-directed DNA polymerase
MERKYPDNPWVWYADDGLVHCRSLEETEALLERLKVRFAECKLELQMRPSKVV